ncbi:polysaccharide deacetylase family protein [Planktothrix sp. FACHB-1355]|uniref:Polysaccharide deacetylase family protein n=1 Tax=Aerosakkonema funiforme FACHB-1375 TaxID=2949571 RepID=A0A926VLX9_9CYAN|nr:MULTISPECIES: polysaccharide deacetylase family protein [Oscillatoriales]MBD2186311.1 polysaccharide deacetylase family protein [Aerosakkonema funiforme FACHB-1375]MBD3561544.1 polysaccharide deacetylase family protein [Planktothrix sp. FACHB-1355]
MFKKVLVFVTLVAAVCSFAIGLNLSVKEGSRETVVISAVAPGRLPITQQQNLDSEVVRQQKVIQNLQFPIVQPHVQVGAESLPSYNEGKYPADEEGKIFTVPTQFQGKMLEKMPILGEKKLIALTFDDGPWPKTTLQVLEILKKNNIKATFFWVGRCVKYFPQIAQQVVNEGHAIANHTWSHSYRKMNPSQAAKEIEDTAELIYKTTGVKTFLFRPPGGLLNNGPADYAKEKNYAIVKWSNDPMDYRPLPAYQLVKNVLRKAKSGDIVLLHDGGGNHSATVKALPEIIDKLKQQGFEFVTIPDLLEMKAQEMNEGESQLKLLPVPNSLPD